MIDTTSKGTAVASKTTAEMKELLLKQICSITAATENRTAAATQ